MEHIVLRKRKCPVCKKEFHPLPEHAYKRSRRYYCCYSCYVQGGGDGGIKRLRGKHREYGYQ
ncbi:hypothetical protein LJC56_10110 [Christensenellaceae bacterium OttesenSCG-928-K19]|nr:hypothetical protein [Christensenellaceae bacterium OttesenSCG-928-K19]